MKIVINVIVGVVVALLTAIVLLVWVNGQLQPLNRDYALKELASTKAAVEKNIDDIAANLLLQLQGFCASVADDRDFAMKLIVEKDYSAPEVADIALSYMKAMGLSFLEVTDADFRILSSGHFPASAGNKSLQKSSLPDSSANFMFDNIKGADVLSLQIKIPFSCAGALFYCVGGIAVDEHFITGLIPHEGTRLIFKHGKDIVGMEDIETMSELKDNSIIINDRSWLAESLVIPWAGEADAPEIIILKEEPADFNLLDVI